MEWLWKPNYGFFHAGVLTGRCRWSSHHAASISERTPSRDRMLSLANHAGWHRRSVSAWPEKYTTFSRLGAVLSCVLIIWNNGWNGNLESTPAEGLCWVANNTLASWLWEWIEKRGDISMTLSRLRVGQRWAWWCSKGRSTLKVIWTIPFTQGSDGINLRCCPYHTSILRSFGSWDIYNLMNATKSGSEIPIWTLENRGREIRGVMRWTKLKK